MSEQNESLEKLGTNAEALTGFTQSAKPEQKENTMEIKIFSDYSSEAEAKITIGYNMTKTDMARILSRAIKAALPEG